MLSFRTPRPRGLFDVLACPLGLLDALLCFLGLFVGTLAFLFGLLDFVLPVLLVDRRGLLDWSPLVLFWARVGVRGTLCAPPELFDLLLPLLAEDICFLIVGDTIFPSLILNSGGSYVHRIVMFLLTKSH